MPFPFPQTFRKRMFCVAQWLLSFHCRIAILNRDVLDKFHVNHFWLRLNSASNSEGSSNQKYLRQLRSLSPARQNDVAV